MGKLLDFRDLLLNWGISVKNVNWLNSLIVAIIVIGVAILSFYVTKFIIRRIIKGIIARSKNDYDDIFAKAKIFDTLSHIVPAIILFVGVNYITSDEATLRFLKDLLYSYIILATLVIIFRFLNAVNDLYEIYAQRKDLSIHIKQYLQVLKILFALTAIILILSLLLNKKPGALIAGLGALTAVLLLIFKDSIMSLVASIQISAYNLVKVGDWITIPSKGVDGDVMDISLNTIKIRNFDKTISTIPTYSIVQEPFINWRGMEMSGGRRIKRSIFIDINSIKLCSPEMIQKFSKIKLVSDYVLEKQKEIDEWNKNNNVPEPVEINGRAQTNIGIFRKYIENYLRSNFRSFVKYKKEKFNIDGKLYEYFVIDSDDEFLKKLAKAHITEINGKTVIKNLEKFLMMFGDYYLLENNFLYKVRKVTENVIVKGVRVEKFRYEKILEKEGYFCDDLTVLVRQLPPTDKGLPIEIYTFAATTEWAKYENIQSDLFDHIFAVLPEFELDVFQQPSSNDVQKFFDTISNKK